MDEFRAFYEMVKKWTIRDYRTQKIKAEVIVDMLISEYIEEIVSQIFGKEIKLIAKEFPIARIGQKRKKNEVYEQPNPKDSRSNRETNRQYASVDFLMSGTESGKPVLYLVELKTSDSSADGVQLWNMLWTCSQGSDSLYSRFYDVIVNYGIIGNGNDLPTKKYQYTLSRYAVNHKLEGCEEGIKSFGKKRLQGEKPIKEEQKNTAVAILSSLKKSFDGANLQIVYVSLNNQMNFANMAQSAFRKGKIQEKIKGKKDEKDNYIRDFFRETVKIRLDGTSEEINEDISSFIAGNDIKQITLNDFTPSKKKAKEWKNIKDILIELQEPWEEAWFNADKLKNY